MMVGNAGNKRICSCPQTHLLCRNTVRVAETALDAAYLGLFLSSLLLLDTGDFDRRTILKGEKKRSTYRFLQGSYAKSGDASDGGFSTGDATIATYSV